jgi:hypothetical protein
LLVNWKTCTKEKLEKTFSLHANHDEFLVTRIHHQHFENKVGGNPDDCSLCMYEVKCYCLKNEPSVNCFGRLVLKLQPGETIKAATMYN